MFIDELAIEQEVTLTARIGHEQIEFKTIVRESIPRKHMILTDIVRKNERIVTFNGKGLIVDLDVSPPDSAPLVFKNVKVILQKKSDDSYCYSVSTITEAKVLNRRQAYRCYVGVSTTVQCGSNRSAHDAVIKDISTLGFAVTASADTEFMEGQVLHALLADYIEELAENYAFHLYGIIVRRQELENGQVIYGCKLNNRVPGLDAYIMKKERIRLKKTNGGGSTIRG